MGTRAPIEDGFDGTGVYAGRFRPTSSARGLQPPKVSDYRQCLDDLWVKLQACAALGGCVHGKLFLCDSARGVPTFLKRTFLNVLCALIG